MDNETQKPLTLDELADYNQKVLLPAFEQRLDILKEKLVTKDEFNGFKNENLTMLDSLSKKIDILLEDKEIR